QAAPADARSTALALRLTGNRLGQVAAPASAGLVAGVAGIAAPFVMLGGLLLAAAGLALRGRGTDKPPEGAGSLRGTRDTEADQASTSLRTKGVTGRS
ncbi:MFS transporter, partial [Streptomyces sp. T-3]|nr:MFS transporter [Streptomyces sp. T-3]